DLRIRKVGIEYIQAVTLHESACCQPAAQRHRPPIQPLEYTRHAKVTWPVHLDAGHDLERRRCRPEIRTETTDQRLPREPRLRRKHDDLQVPGDAEHSLA